MRKTPGFKSLLAVAAAATVLRLVLVLHATWFPVSDSRDYHDFARSLAQGRGYVQVYEGETPSFRGLTLRAYRMPGYPVFLAAVYQLGGWKPQAAYLANVVCDLVTLFALAGIARTLFGGWAALFAASLFALHVLWTPNLMSETLFTALFTVVAWLLVARLPRATPRTALACGMAILAAVFVRPIALCALPVAAAVVWRSGTARRPLLLLLVAAPTALGIAAWTLRNARVLHAFVPFSTNFGAHNAGLVGIDLNRAVFAVRRRGGGEVEIDREIRREIGRRVRADVPWALRIYGERAVDLLRRRPDWSMNAVLLPRTFTGDNGARWVLQLYTRLHDWHRVLDILALAGAVLLLARRRWWLGGLWPLFVCFVLLHAAVSRSDVRFAAPLEPLLCLSGAYPLAWVVDRVQRLRGRRVTEAGAVVRITSARP